MMRDFFEVMSYLGGLLAMLVFFTGMVIFAVVLWQEQREQSDDGLNVYDWETME
jgi:hypothetical protein